METDLDKIAVLAENREDENIRFRQYLKRHSMSDKKLDELVHEITDAVSEQIDCSSCRNCCKKLSAEFSHEDIDTICHFLNMPEDKLLQKYHIREDVYRYIMDESNSSDPGCPFCDEDKCMIEEVRPEDCKDFPFLKREGFRQRLFGVISNYAVCPIAFNVFEQLKTALNWRAGKRSRSRRF